MRLLSLSALALSLGTATAELDHARIQRSLEARTWAHETRDLLDSFGDLKTCTGCQSVLSVLKGLVKENDDTLMALGGQLCESASNYDEEFCNGLVQREVPAIASIIRTMKVGSPSSIEFCRTFLGVCDPTEIEPWLVPFKKPKPCPVVYGDLPSGKKTVQIVHYSDIHIDPLYQEGSSTECKKPTCCRPYTKADEPGKTKNPAGPFGDHNCDSPISLEKSMYQYIKKEFPDALFSVFTGDIVDHGLFNTSRPYNEEVIEGSYDRMSKDLNLVYGTAGNHEAHPPNIFEPISVGNDTHWVYDTLADQWGHWVGDSPAKQARDFGAYSVRYPKGNLRVISLNTNLYYRLNFILYQKTIEKDPSGQFAWLVKELEKASDAKENVYIIGHMPMGDIDAMPAASNYFAQITTRFDKIIRGMFFGHTHWDHFQVNYNNYTHPNHKKANIVSYIAPSLTPTPGMPAFRVYDVDPETFMVMNAHTYIADMNDKNFQTNGPVWKKYYSAKETYGPRVDPPYTDPAAELTPAFWHNVTESFTKNQTWFNEFLERKVRGWKPDTACKHDCRDKEVCYLRGGRAQDNCWVPNPSIHFSKRDEHSEHIHAKHDECGASVSRDLLSALTRRIDMLQLVQEHFVTRGAKLEAPYVLEKREEPSSVAPEATQTGESCDSGLNKTTTGGTGTGTGTATGVTVVPTTKGNAASGLVPAASWIVGVLAAFAF